MLNQLVTVSVKKPDGTTYQVQITYQQFFRKNVRFFDGCDQVRICLDSKAVSLETIGQPQWIEIDRKGEPL